jgi:hypothetical protein
MGKVAKRTTGGFSTPSAPGLSRTSRPCSPNSRTSRTLPTRRTKPATSRGSRPSATPSPRPIPSGQSAKNNIADRFPPTTPGPSRTPSAAAWATRPSRIRCTGGTRRWRTPPTWPRTRRTPAAMINLNLAKAQFIANRNDVGPDLGIFSNLMQQAASDASGAKRSGTIMPGGMGGGARRAPAASAMSSGGGGGGGGGGSAVYWTNSRRGVLGGVRQLLRGEPAWRPRSANRLWHRQHQHTPPIRPRRWQA